MVTALSPPSPDRLAAAYACCERIARAHYENFPVASWLLPAAMRPHIAAIYAFARRADDFADEPGLADAERLRLLAEWEDRLMAEVTEVRLKPDATGVKPDATGGTEVRLKPDTTGDSNETDLIFEALEHTIAVHHLPRPLFHDLVSAFRQDVTTTRYATWDDVLDYCRRSANPVGRLVLRVAGYDDAKLDAASDAVCTALQLTNFWQDFAIDWSRGRLYLPLAARDRAGARDSDLYERRITPEWQAALADAAARTRALFATGRPVCDSVAGRLRWELRFTWLGGSRILDKLEASNFDVFNHRPSLGAADVPMLVRGAYRWWKRR